MTNSQRSGMQSSPELICAPNCGKSFSAISIARRWSRQSPKMRRSSVGAPMLSIMAFASARSASPETRLTISRRRLISGLLLGTNFQASNYILQLLYFRFGICQFFIAQNQVKARSLTSLNQVDELNIVQFKYLFCLVNS